MKRDITLLILGIVVVLFGGLLKINQNTFGQYVMITGLIIEVYALASIVLKSLRK